MPLQQQVAVVTGSGSGIGRGIALRLAAEGARVVVNDIRVEAADETVAEIQGAGQEAIPGVADVTRWESAQHLVEIAVAHWGRIDILVNNVGAVRDNRIVNMPVEDWDFILNLNLTSYFLVTKATAPQMISQECGRIVNISSRAWLGQVGQTNYSASKAGIVGMSRSLALELGRHGITVNTVAPGLIDTPLVRALPEKVQERLLRMQPTGKVGTPADVANAVAFFAQPEAHYITGQVLHVCGGKSVKCDW